MHSVFIATWMEMKHNLGIKKTQKRAVAMFLLLTENQKWQDKRIRKTDVLQRLVLQNIVLSTV